MNKELPTQDEINRVHEWECTRVGVGHDFTIITVQQSNDPYAIVCAHCNRKWKVENASSE